MPRGTHTYNHDILGVGSGHEILGLHPAPRSTTSSRSATISLHSSRDGDTRYTHLPARESYGIERSDRSSYGRELPDDDRGSMRISSRPNSVSSRSSRAESHNGTVPASRSSDSSLLASTRSSDSVRVRQGSPQIIDREPFIETRTPNDHDISYVGLNFQDDVRYRRHAPQNRGSHGRDSNLSNILSSNPSPAFNRGQNRSLHRGSPLRHSQTNSRSDQYDVQRMHSSRGSHPQTRRAPDPQIIDRRPEDYPPRSRYR